MRKLFLIAMLFMGVQVHANEDKVAQLRRAEFLCHVNAAVIMVGTICSTINILKKGNADTYAGPCTVFLVGEFMLFEKVADKLRNMRRELQEANPQGPRQV